MRRGLPAIQLLGFEAAPIATGCAAYLGISWNRVDQVVLSNILVINCNADSRGIHMNHICPNCSKRSFTFLGLLSAATHHGATCPSCGTVVQFPRWARFSTGLPLIAWVVWEYTARPPAEAEIYGLTASAALMVMYVFAFILTLPLVRAKQAKS